MIINSLHSPAVRAVLDRLHAEADGQKAQFLQVVLAMGKDKLLRRTKGISFIR